MCTVLSTVSLHVVLCVYESDAYDGVPIWYVWYYMYVHDWMADYPSCVCLCCVMTHLPVYIVHSTSHVLNISLLTLLCIDCLCVWHWATLPRCGSWHQLLWVENSATVLWNGSISLLCSHNGELKTHAKPLSLLPPSFLSLFSLLFLSSSPYLHPLASQFTAYYYISAVTLSLPR